MTVWVICLVASIAALVQAFLFYKSMIASDPGNERMQEIAGYVRIGAYAYLRQQYVVERNRTCKRSSLNYSATGHD